MFDDVKVAVRKKELSARRFAEAIQVEPKIAVPFLYDGIVPDGDAGADLVARVRRWLAAP